MQLPPLQPLQPQLFSMGLRSVHRVYESYHVVVLARGSANLAVGEKQGERGESEEKNGGGKERSRGGKGLGNVASK